MRLADLLEFPSVIAAAELALPPFKGRQACLNILNQPAVSHRIDSVDLPGIAHPLAAADAPGYRIFRAVPKRPAGPAGHPVLYLLDGNAGFDFLTAEMLALVPDLIVIGVGYDTGGQFDRLSRARDLTFPAPGQIGLVPDAGYGDRPTGGARQFAALLSGPIRQAAEQGLTVDPSRRSLWGHSLGGLFVLNLCGQSGSGFSRFAAISPSLWWHPERLETVQRDRQGAPLPPLYLACGNREQRTGTPGPLPTEPPDSFLALVRQLRAIPGADVSMQIYDGAVHIASLPSSLPSTLRFAAI